MLIQLRQSEIEEALKMYVVSQGFSLNNKTVDISFTSGRKDNGVSADLDINDTGAAIPSGPVNRTFAAEPIQMPSLPVLSEPGPLMNDDDAEVPDTPVAAVEVKVAGSSLFG